MPPSLAWLPVFCESTSFPLDQAIVADAYPTVNPLTYTVELKWREPISPKCAMIVWNLFQKWAAVNSVIPLGRVEFHKPAGDAPVGMTITVVLRERLGPPRTTHP